MKRLINLVMVCFLITKAYSQSRIPKMLKIEQTAVGVDTLINQSGFNELKWLDEKGILLASEDKVRLIFNDTELVFFIVDWEKNKGVWFSKWIFRSKRAVIFAPS